MTLYLNEFIELSLAFFMNAFLSYNTHMIARYKVVVIHYEIEGQIYLLRYVASSMRTIGNSAIVALDTQITEATLTQTLMRHARWDKFHRKAVPRLVTSASARQLRVIALRIALRESNEPPSDSFKSYASLISWRVRRSRKRARSEYQDQLSSEEESSAIIFLLSLRSLCDLISTRGICTSLGAKCIKRFSRKIGGRASEKRIFRVIRGRIAKTRAWDNPYVFGVRGSQETSLRTKVAHIAEFLSDDGWMGWNRALKTQNR